MDRERRRVIAGYDSAYPDPLVVDRGASVHVERRETEWAGWLWCTAANGRAGWAPESWIDVGAGGDTGVMRRAYTARELTVAVDDEVEVSSIESGWAWARTRSGETGWLPLRCLGE